jgi:glycosyltransferase involved in cell wall biosynthesis
MSGQPLVSIVMPTYNRLRFLPSAVQSILSQTLRHWELIVADDGSHEPTRDYLASLEQDARVRVLYLPHSGNPGRARNAAITAARAPLVAFIDSDDLWEPTKLERQIAALRGEPECGWSYTAFVIVDADDTPLPSEHDRAWTPYRGRIFDKVVRGWASIRTPAVVVGTDLVRDAGGFDEAIDCGEDYDLWARLALRSPACVVDEPLVRVRRHRDIDARKIARAHVARDYWLRKLAAQANGAQRSLLVEERGRNALVQAAVLTAHGHRARALAAVTRSLSVGWRYRSWWYGAAKAVARAALAAPPRHRRADDATSSSAETVEARLERTADELRPGDR